jgi:hypothetical protein
MSDELEQRPTDAPFGPDEADRIIAALRDGRALECPRCHGKLDKGPPSSPTSSQFRVYLVRCPECRRAVFHGEYLRRSTT